MHNLKPNTTYVALVVLFLLTLVSGTALAGQHSSQPEHYLTFTPTIPSPGQEVIVSLMSPYGRPATKAIRWSLAGAPFVNAGVKEPDPTKYGFIPNGPGSYVITAEFQDAAGTYVSTSLEISINTKIPTQTNTGGQVTAAPGSMFLATNPEQPRLNQSVTFALRFGNALPTGSEVRWQVSGGATNSLSITGINKEVCTFMPTGTGTYLVRSTLYSAQGVLLGEVTLGFIPVP